MSNDNEVKALIELVKNNTIAQATEDAERVESLLKHFSENSAEGKFIRMVLTWAADTEKSQALWEVLNRAICIEPGEIHRSLHSFVANCFLDDSYFIVKWHRPKLEDDNLTLCWDRQGGLVYEDVDQDAERASPYVAVSGEGSRNAQELIDALLWVENRRRERAAFWGDDD